MPQEQAVGRTDKLTKLVAVLDQFHEAIAQFDESTAKRLVENWAGIRHRYAVSSSIPRSALAAGIEQGLHETPMLLQSMHPETRRYALQALASATSAHYPDILLKNAARLAKIKVRGSIRGESEYHFVRHHIDIVEGKASQREELKLLHALVEKFESRGK